MEDHFQAMRAKRHKAKYNRMPFTIVDGNGLNTVYSKVMPMVKLNPYQRHSKM
jgi:hypothetical protein